VASGARGQALGFADRDRWRAASPSGEIEREPAGHLEATRLSEPGIELYVDYIQRARTFDGTAYYIVPMHWGGCGFFHRSGEGIFVEAVGGGGGGAGVAAIKEPRWVMTSGDANASTIEMVVPDGVARVTLRYPPGPANGYHAEQISPAFTVTTTAAGNLVLVRVPRSPGGRAVRHPAAMIWQAANGHVIRTFRRL
jgi:hypothetical protein